MNTTILGSGTSHGAPPIDCIISDYATCSRGVCLKAQTDPRHRRSRSSLWVQTEHACILIDTSQDFCQQMLENGVTRIDADHIYGLPDIRSYCQQQHQSIPVYGSAETLATLQRASDYAFRRPGYTGGGVPTLAADVLDDALALDGLCIETLPMVHYGLPGLPVLPHRRHGLHPGRQGDPREHAGAHARTEPADTQLSASDAGLARIAFGGTIL